MTVRAERLNVRAALLEPRQIGIAAIVVGVAACWVALPPVTARSFVWPIVLGVLAAAAGAWTIRAGEKRVGWGAIAAALLGVVGGIASTQAATGNLKTVFVWSALFAAMLRWATPLTFASIGGMFSERSGVVNIGLEGMMLMGAFFGIWGADKTGSWVLGIVIAVIAGGALALVHAFFAIQLRADQIVGGTAINFLALGITGYLFIDIYGDAGTPSGVSQIPDIHFHFLDNVYFLGPAIGQLNLMIWLSIVVLVGSYVFMFRTPYGLRLRSVGEHPRVRRAPARRGYRRHQRVRGALQLGDRVGHARRARRRVSLDRLRRRHVRGEHDDGPRLHRARRADLRQVAPLRRVRRRASLRLLDRARVPAVNGARVVVVGDPLPGAPVRRHDRRRRRRDRPLDPPGSDWPSLHEALAGGTAAPGRLCCWA